MQSARELRRAVEDFDDDLIRQYGRETPACEILHQELGLPRTLKPNADEIRSKMEEHHIEVSEDSLKLMVEHDDLHEALRRIVLDAMSQGQQADQLAAKMLSIGRRMGFREAAGLLEGTDG